MSKPETALAMPASPEVMDVMQLGGVLAKSGYFAEAREAAQAVVKVLAGREMGFGPIASMTGVHIIKGKPSVGANLMAAAIKRSGRYDYKVRELTATACKLEFFERADKGWQSIGESSFTADDAKTAGLAGGDNHKHFPRNMLFARAMSNGAKWYTPDIFGGPVYTPDELGAVVNHETGEVIEGDKPTPYEPEPDGPISAEQVKRFWAIARQHKWTEEQVKKLLNDHSHESSKDILRSEYEALVEQLKSGTDAKANGTDAQQTLA